MEVSKTIYGRVGPRGTYTEGMITEEDYGILFQMPDLDLPAAYQVDFSNKLTGGTALTVVGNSDGALIPTSLIDSGKDVYAFLYYTGVGFGKTTHVFRINNNRRAKRGTPAPTPEQQSVIDQTIAALNTAVESTAADAEQTASDAARAEAAREAAESAENNAEASATAAAQSEANASASESTASAAATSASASASSAATNADRAEQSAKDAGYMYFYINDEGDLIYQRTSNVNVDFYLDNDGDLHVRANG
jgi:hypothetical protein